MGREVKPCCKVLGPGGWGRSGTLLGQSDLFTLVLALRGQLLSSAVELVLSIAESGPCSCSLPGDSHRPLEV